MKYKTLEKREINNEQVNSVLASELHQHLEVKTKFTDWLNREVINDLFEEGVDYVIVWEGIVTKEMIQKLEKVPKLKHNLTESTMSELRLTEDFGLTEDKISTILKLTKNAILTTSTSKEISMMSKTPQGKISRTYFINVEKVALKELGRDKLQLEVRKLDQRDKELVLEEVEHKEKMIDIRVKRFEYLQKLGLNLDPIALINNGSVKSKLPKDMAELMTNAYSDIRIHVPAKSATHLLKELRVGINVKEFNEALLSAEFIEEYTFKHKRYKRWVSETNYFGFSKHSSSKSKFPVSILFYSDRFSELILNLKTSGHLDID